MKLRYYMRGLGIGIIVTALTMGIAAGDGRPLTDAEIKAAALKLGMVESDSLRLTDIQPASAPGVNAASGENGSSQEEEDSPETGKPQDSEETAESPVPEPEETSESTPAPEESPTASSEPEETQESAPPAPEEAAPEEDSGTVTITVKSGSGSRTVCNQLEEAGLIEDAGSFDQYLIDNGYSKRICVGTYEITVGSDWEQIAKIISRTR